MGSVGEDDDCEEVILSPLTVSKRSNEESKGRDSKSKRLRICEPGHQGFGVSEEVGREKKGTITNGVLGFGEEMNLNVNVVSYNCGLNFPHGVTMDLDLNLGFQDMENDDSVPAVAERRVEIIGMPSDVKIADGKDVNGSTEQIDKENADEVMNNIDLLLSLVQTTSDISSSARGERRYSREEKGKAKVSDSWLSLSLNGEHSPIYRDLAFGTKKEQKVEEFEAQLEEDGDEKTSDFINHDFPYDDSPYQDEREEIDMDDFWRRAREQRELERRQTARRFARSEGHIEAPINTEKASSEENADEVMNNIDLISSLVQTTSDINSSARGERRYSTEEKGKAKVSDSWLSLSLNGEHSPIYRDLAFGTKTEQKVEEFEAQLEEDGDEKTSDFINHDLPCDDSPDQDEREEIDMDDFWRRAREQRELERRQTARRFARSEGHIEAPTNKEKASSEDDELLGKSSGPFSTALKTVRERSSRSHEQLIKWEPSNKGCNRSRDLVPALLDLSLKALSQNAEAIVSLELVPDMLRQRFTDLLCNLRKMNVLTLELLLNGSPTEVRIKDSSWLTEEQFLKTFGNFNTKELMVLQLDLCGQCNLDYLMSKTFAQFSNSLPKLGIISLKGACRLSDNGLKALITSAPRLQSINLGQSSLLTHASINIFATSLGSILKELYIDECVKIDAILALPALKKFEHLEVLSVAGIQTVSDLFVHELMVTCGQRIMELDLANCQALTDYSLKVIGDSSTKLRSLNISKLEKLTDLGLLFLADGCRCIETLKFSRNNFSDEAIAAFLEASGESLKDLSLNNVTLAGPCTALSLAKCSRKLLSLDLSWCRKITNEALGLIVDSCSSLKLVKLFGCTQITDIFLNGHSNPEVQIVGLKLSPILESTAMLEPHGTLLRYSPLASI